MMGNRLRAILRVWIEDRLPWYSRVIEAERDAKTEEIRQDSIKTRITAEQRLDSYRNVRLRRR